MLESFDKIEEKLFSSYQNGTLHHAILISGRNGIGKADFAKKLAAKILSTTNIDNHPDFKHISKPSGKKNISIDLIRQISGFFQSSSSQGAAKIAFIESIEDLNTSSSNAILKILEEPNNNCYLILTCGNFAQTLPTIKSRCQIHKIKNLSFNEFKDSFNKQRPSFLPPLSEEELNRLAILTENSPRLAIKNGDEFLSIFKIIESSILKKYISQHEINEILKSDFDLFATIFQIFISMLLKINLDQKTENFFPELKQIAEMFSKNDLIKIYDQSRRTLIKTKNVYLDQKLVVINSIESLSRS